MKCPNCGATLKKDTYKGIDVDLCPKCSGMWFDLQELDTLEDQVESDDEMKGTTILESFSSDRTCPKCNEPMKGFYYRMHNELKLEYCPNKHGWWLDKDEADRVLELMRKEKTDVAREKEVEDQWIKTLWRMKNPSFFERLLSHLH